MRVDKVSFFVHRADPIRVAICDQPGVAMLTYDGLLRCLHVRKNGLRIDTGEKRIHISAQLDELDAMGAEHAGEDASS